MKPILLGVNIDHVATLREVRGTDYPDLLEAAMIVKDAGADSITVHLREDRRHIQDQDVSDLKKQIDINLNLEMAITDEMLEIATDIRPEYCCFVPEKRQELTTEGGLDVVSDQNRVIDACIRMKDAGIRPSLFIDADPEQIRAAADCGTGVIEIHTGQYAEFNDDKGRNRELRRVNESVSLAVSLGLQVNAGHGLNYDNVNAIAAIEDIHELNIGHAIVARALFTGLENAVSEMKRLIDAARQ